MVKNILILTDFSYCAKKAADYAIALFGTKQVTYTFLHTIQYRQAGALFSYKLSNDLKAYAIKEMDTLLENKRAKYPGIKVDSTVTFGGIVSATESVCLKHDYDCVVLGTNGSSGAYERILGSSAHALLKELERNILVVPVTSFDALIDTVFFALNFTQKNIQKVVKTACSLVENKVQKLDLITIYNDENETKLANIFLENWKKETLNFPVALSLHENNGETIENQIIEISGNHKADLVIISPNKDKSIWDRIFGKRVSEEIVTNTYLPLLIIK